MNCLSFLVAYMWVTMFLVVQLRIVAGAEEINWYHKISTKIAAQIKNIWWNDAKEHGNINIDVNIIVQDATKKGKHRPHHHVQKPTAKPSFRRPLKQKPSVVPTVPTATPTSLISNLPIVSPSTPPTDWPMAAPSTVPSAAVCLVAGYAKIM